MKKWIVFCAAAVLCVRSASAAGSLTVTPIKTCKGAMVQISCEVPRQSTVQCVSLKILDTQGRLVRAFTEETPGGTFLAWWDCASDGKRLAAGSYPAVLTVGNAQVTACIQLTDR